VGREAVTRISPRVFSWSTKAIRLRLATPGITPGECWEKGSVMNLHNVSLQEALMALAVIIAALQLVAMVFLV
jgi:hypothetical protein